MSHLKNGRSSACGCSINLTSKPASEGRFEVDEPELTPLEACFDVHRCRASTTIDAFKGRCEVDQPTSTPFEGTTLLDRSGRATSGGLAGAGHVP